ncbi:DNA-binding transcriptional LysR family regulator [Rhizobium mesoamericanum]|nr:DNA-binding transcriptional LysR family regulator [Rhizobium mesoamericanum]
MSSSRAVKNACLTGYGYALLAEFMVAEDLAAGSLIRLLPDYRPVEQSIYAFYAQRFQTPRKVRVFVDYLVEAFGS